MHIKGQLKDAQLEVFTTAARPAPGKKGRKIYDSDLEVELVDTGVAWKGSFDNLQDQFDGQTSSEQGAWRSKMHAIGDIVSSFLSEAQFQAEYDNKWILCDGRAVSGSDYETLTGNSNIPDARGLVQRGKNNARSDGKQNPAGDLALGTYEADAYKDHTHSVSHEMWVAGATPGKFGIGSNSGGGPAIVLTSSGGSTGSNANETRVKSIAVNYFIKINR